MYNSQGLAVTWIMVSCVMMQGSQYRPTKIPLESVRAFEFGEVYCYPPIDSKVSATQLKMYSKVFFGVFSERLH